MADTNRDCPACGQPFQVGQVVVPAQSIYRATETRAEMTEFGRWNIQVAHLNCPTGPLPKAVWLEDGKAVGLAEN